jgi:predicted ATP-binding protein involved in virulence
MLIRELHIKNFRRFEDLKVSFEDDLTVLVARNGHGKSSILEAITILLGTFVGAFDLGRAKGLTARDARRSLQPSTKEPRQDWPVRIEGSVIFELPPFDLSQNYLCFPEFELWRPGHPIARELPSAKSRTTTREVSILTAYGQHLQALIHRADNAILPVIAYYGTGRLWKAHKNILRKQVLTQNRSLGYEDCLSSASNFVQVQQWMDRASRARSQELERNEDEHWGPRLKGIQQAVDSVLEDERWSQFAYSYDYEELSMVHPDHGRLAVSQMSDGVRGVVSLVADLAFRCMRLNSPMGEDAILETKGIVLIDEVDQHLHPGWQQRILQSIRKAFPNIQFIVTTHSPEVLTTVESRQIRILQDGKCYGAPAGTLGAESSRLLQTVLGIKSLRPPLTEVAELNEYLELVYTGCWKDPRAIALRQKLDQLYQGEEPALLEADLQIENQEWEAPAQ